MTDVGRIGFAALVVAACVLRLACASVATVECPYGYEKHSRTR